MTEYFVTADKVPLDPVEREKFWARDLMKAYSKTMIALENEPHWKTGYRKRLVYDRNEQD